MIQLSNHAYSITRIGVCFVVVWALLGAVMANAAKPPVQSAVKPEVILKNLSESGDLIEAKNISGDIPLDPGAQTWASTNSQKITLVSQSSIAPKGQSRTIELTLRALANAKELGFWLSWPDASKNDSVAASEYFQDAIAVEFPTQFGGTKPLPYIGMGNKGRAVNVWQWKASWQLDVDQGFQGVEKVYWKSVPKSVKAENRAGEEAGSSLSQRKKQSPVENLVAEGFGSLTTIDAKGLSGKGVWDGKNWTVVIKRSLKGMREGEPTFDGFTPVAFAIWDGGERERNGMKVIGRWRFVKLEKKQVSANAVSSLLTQPIADADPAKGKSKIEALGCFQCHVIPGFSQTPSFPGPDLTNSGLIHRPEYLVESIKAPSAVVVPYPGYYDPDGGNSTMPEYDPGQLPPEEYKNIAAYLGSAK